MRIERNTLTGFVEKAYISDFQFENQRRTFHSYDFTFDLLFGLQKTNDGDHVSDSTTCLSPHG